MLNMEDILTIRSLINSIYSPSNTVMNGYIILMRKDFFFAQTRSIFHEFFHSINPKGYDVSSSINITNP